MHQSVANRSIEYKEKEGRFNYVTPTSFLELLSKPMLKWLSAACMSVKCVHMALTSPVFHRLFPKVKHRSENGFGESTRSNKDWTRQTHGDSRSSWQIAAGSILGTVSISYKTEFIVARMFVVAKEGLVTEVPLWLGDLSWNCDRPTDHL